MKTEISVEPEYTVTLSRQDAEDLVFLADNHMYIKQKFSEVNVDNRCLHLLATLGAALKKLGVRS